MRLEVDNLSVQYDDVSFDIQIPNNNQCNYKIRKDMRNRGRQRSGD